MQTVIFFKRISLRKHFFSNIILVQTTIFSIFFSAFLLFLLNITITLLNYSKKNVINSSIATYFVDIRSNHHLKFFGSY